MISDWEILIECCKERSLDPMVVIKPEAHKAHAESHARAQVLRAMKRRGVATASLQTLCPLDPRTIQGIVNEGPAEVRNQQKQVNGAEIFHPVF